jgi:hypothetical protein
MKIRLLQPASVLLSQGNVVDVNPEEAEALIRTRIAEEWTPPPEKAETPKRKYA